MENTGLYLKIFGCSDNLIKVERNGQHYNEIDCLNYDVVFEIEAKIWTIECQPVSVALGLRYDYK